MLEPHIQGSKTCLSLSNITGKALFLAAGCGREVQLFQEHFEEIHVHDGNGSLLRDAAEIDLYLTKRERAEKRGDGDRLGPFKPTKITALI